MMTDKRKAQKEKENTQTQPIPNPVSSTAPLFFCVPNQPSISSKPRAVILTKEMSVARRSGGSRNLSSRVHACMHVFVHSCTRTPHPLIRPYIHTSRMYVCVCVYILRALYFPFPYPYPISEQTQIDQAKYLSRQSITFASKQPTSCLRG